MKIKFPVFIRYKKQYDLLMRCLEEKTTIKWKSDDRPTLYKPLEFPSQPIYVLYWEDTNSMTYVYEEDAEWLDDNYEECEVEVED